MGWRTITGTVVFGLGFALEGFGMDAFAAACKALGAMLGGYGVRRAIANKQQ